MKAIYKKELNSYFNGVIGCVCIALLLLVVGIYFWVYNLNYGYPQISAILNAITFVFLITVPILTMRSIAEEKKQKTDQLLLTSPVTVTKIVLGKYFALETIILIPMIVVCIYPVLLSFFGASSFASDYTAILGFFLLGSAFLSIGLFISSITESQVIAAVVSFIVIFISYLMDGITGFIGSSAVVSYIGFFVLILAAAFAIYALTRYIYLAAGIGLVCEIVLTILYIVKSSLLEGEINSFLGIFAMTSHFSNFADGIFDITGVVYYLSVIVLALLLTVQSIQKRRWS